ncbi:MAG: hypothetical protein PQJ60_14235 [Spirochaetales bacterium]|nr:hypothetical protein [Spirochaetales bacterium]
MKQFKTHRSVLISSFLFLFMLSCQTVPVNKGTAYYLPGEGDRILYLDGGEADRFLKPMADSLGMEGYGKIQPILKETDRIYLVTRGEALYIQGQGEYSTGFINLVLGTNREWRKEKIGPYRAYRSESTALEVAFPDGNTFLLSQGGMEELLDAYHGGGSQDYPFPADREEGEALLLRLSLEEGNVFPVQLKTPLKTAEMALTPGEGETLYMDVGLWGDENSGRLMGSALKLFLLASVGRAAMNSPVETGDDYALIRDVPVDFDFLMKMMGI